MPGIQLPIAPGGLSERCESIVSETQLSGIGPVTQLKTPYGIVVDPINDVLVIGLNSDFGTRAIIHQAQPSDRPSWPGGVAAPLRRRREATSAAQTGWWSRHRRSDDVHHILRQFQQCAVLETQHLDPLRLQVRSALRVVFPPEHVVVHATLNLDRRLVLRTVEVQNVRPNSVLAAKLRSSGRFLRASPENLLGQIVDLFYGS